MSRCISQDYRLVSGGRHPACCSMLSLRAARTGQLYILLLATCLRLLCLDSAEAQPAGVIYKLPSSGEPTSILQPSSAAVNGTTPRTSLPQLATCGCPAAEQDGKVTGSSVVAAMQNLTTATQWTVDQTIVLSDQDVFHTEVGHRTAHIGLCVLMKLLWCCDHWACLVHHKHEVVNISVTIACLHRVWLSLTTRSTSLLLRCSTEAELRAGLSTATPKCCRSTGRTSCAPNMDAHHSLTKT